MVFTLLVKYLHLQYFQRFRIIGILLYQRWMQGEIKRDKKVKKLYCPLVGAERFKFRTIILMI